MALRIEELDCDSRDWLLMASDMMVSLSSTGKGNSFRVMGIIGAKLEILSADGE
jgi:hypothetical protein